MSTQTTHEEQQTDASEDPGQEARKQATGAEGAEQPPAAGTGEDPGADAEPETFPRAYVEQLRREAGDARVKAKDRDDIAQRLHTSLVAATGRLADPTDLAFEDEHLQDEAALSTAIDELLAAKPHLASRRPRGDVGQGRTSDPGATVDLAALLRSRA